MDFTIHVDVYYKMFWLCVQCILYRMCSLSCLTVSETGLLQCNGSYFSITLCMLC